MRRNGAENVMLYYRAIPGMIKLLRQEQQGLESDYNSLRGTTYDGMPHGSTPGKPTEEQAVRLSEKGTYDRLQEIRVRLDVLDADAATIRTALDAMSGKYKSLVSMKLLRGYSWGKISVRLGVPDSTARYQFRMALDRLAELLDDVPMADELEGRASRARCIFEKRNRRSFLR